jgi:hypothetical protein
LIFWSIFWCNWVQAFEWQTKALELWSIWVMQ